MELAESVPPSPAIIPFEGLWGEDIMLPHCETLRNLETECRCLASLPALALHASSFDSTRGLKKNVHVPLYLLTSALALFPDRGSGEQLGWASVPALSELLLLHICLAATIRVSRIGVWG